MLAYRSIRRSSTGFTPVYLHNGRELRLSPQVASYVTTFSKLFMQLAQTCRQLMKKPKTAQYESDYPLPKRLLRYNKTWNYFKAENKLYRHD